MSTGNGPDDRVGSGETVHAVIIRADGSKSRIEHTSCIYRLKQAIKSVFIRARSGF